jgi:hypothetical protein
MGRLGQLAARGAALWLAATLAAACAGSADSPSGEGGTTQPASHPGDTATASGKPVAIPGHNGSHRSRCASCHGPEDREKPRWKEIAGQYGHDVAGLLDERSTCECCHLGTVKGFGEPFEARCLDCHEDIKVTIPKMGSQHCVSCHTLGSGNASEMALRAWECQKCHADKQGESVAIDVHGGEDCANCHRPHEEPWTEPRECSDCHARQEAVHHGKAAEGREGPLCNDCHAPHEQAGEAAGKCVSCHTKEHPAIVAKALFPGHDACTNCHAPHAFDKGEATDCATCHKQQRTMAGRGAKEHADCQSCHSTHDVRAASAGACAKCHGGVTSTHPDAKGTSCVSCHDPHPSATATGGAAAIAAANCASCHSSVRGQQADHGALACQKCHEPHKESKNVQLVCKDCHTAQLAAVSSQPKHADCTGCHTGGAHRPTTNVGACAGCHQTVQDSAPKGHSDCTKCHDSHSGKRLATAECKSCHATEAVGAIALGHKDCSSCHRPHGPDGPASPPSCNSCHQKNKLLALHSLDGHAKCSDCHKSAHAPARNDRATCITCHANEKDHQPDAQVCSGCHRFKGQ